MNANQIQGEFISLLRQNGEKRDFCSLKTWGQIFILYSSLNHFINNKDLTTADYIYN